MSIFFSEPSGLLSAPVYPTSYRMRGALNVAIERYRDLHGRSARLLVLGVQKFRELAKEVLSPSQQLEADLNPLAVRMQYREMEILVDLKDPQREDLF